MNEQSRAGYWRETKRLTLLLLAIWLGLTFGVAWFANDLNEISFIGFPFGFYMGAQGSLILYLLLIWIYNRCMKKLDAKYGIEDD